MPDGTPRHSDANPSESSCYIHAYGTSEHDCHWFPMRVAYDKDILKIGETLEEHGIEYFLPTDEEVDPRPEGHRIIRKPKLSDLIFVHTTKAELTELKHTRSLCRYLRFITYIPHEELRTQMTPMERSAVNRILIIQDEEMTRFIDTISKTQVKVTLIPYSEAFRHIGRKIRILQGPLAGTVGTLRRIKNNKHVHIDYGGIVTVELGYMPREMYEVV